VLDHEMMKLLEDGRRWQALDVATGVESGWCAACELVGRETPVNVDGCAVVPWDVMGDSRRFVFVCDYCTGARLVGHPVGAYLVEYIVRVEVRATSEDQARNQAAEELKELERAGFLSSSCEFWSCELNDEDGDDDGGES